MDHGNTQRFEDKVYLKSRCLIYQRTIAETASLFSLHVEWKTYAETCGISDLENYLKRKKHATTTCSWRRAISSAASVAKGLDRGEDGKSMRKYISGTGAREKDANGCLKATTN
ncbi:hypothetical protein T11_15256 [Trichinella zimbabwensis]|uniref:Uncharacterized protein n=1 Tax=Trichinella zimbabwensis TaxID=268475 RepID=A0A0V1HCW7_9BILA|nr:hypothetical protein T11_15256 [Trichinella zimbabwensis]